MCSISKTWSLCFLAAINSHDVISQACASDFMEKLVELVTSHASELTENQTQPSIGELVEFPSDP